MAKILVTTTTGHDRSRLRDALQEDGHDVRLVADDRNLLPLLAAGPFDIVFVDAQKTLDDPLDLISFIRQSSPLTDIVVLAEVSELALAAASIRRGASLYLLEPVEPEQVLTVVDGALRRQRNALIVREADHRSVDGFFGSSPTMAKLLRLIRKVAPTDATVLVTGESGTGKEVVANIIHRLSPRAQQGKLVPVNCGALPENLLESELFGHAKGSFTGAVQEKPGLLQESDKGTVFLDEVAAMPPPLQVKLLRFLQDRMVRRVGAVRSEKVDVRVIAATNKNLVTEIAAKRFREDLFFRLNVVQIYLPPLRDRRDTIPLLASSFLSRFVRQYDKPILRISAEAQNILMSYAYPGNIRELENIIEFACIMAEGTSIDVTDLPPQLTALQGQYVLPATTFSADETAQRMAEGGSEGGEPSPTAERSGAHPAGANGCANDAGKAGAEVGGPMTLAELETAHIKAVLHRCGGNQTLAAKQLGISRTSLWRKMRGLEG